MYFYWVMWFFGFEAKLNTVAFGLPGVFEEMVSKPIKPNYPMKTHVFAASLFQHRPLFLILTKLK